MRRLLLTLMLCTTACSDDEDGPHDLLDSGLPDSGGPDAQADLDAKVDASLDGGSCELGQRYRYTHPGGLTSQVTSYAISATGVYEREAVPNTTPGVPDAGFSSCEQALDCERIEALRAALHHADVEAAWDDGEIVLGEDARTYDGQITVLERVADGKKIAIGVDCATEPSCTAIPSGVRALRELIRQLDAATCGGT